MLPQKSLKRQFNNALILIYLASLLISLPLVYYFSSKSVYNNANKELSLLVDMVYSMRRTISKDVRPELLKQNILSPASALSSTVFTRHTAVHFNKLRPNYYIKVASDNPLNPDNKTLTLEQEILDYFRAHTDEKKLIREGFINGKKFLLSSTPSISKESCNICHSTPENAPKQIVEMYGTKSGYGYEKGDIVGASFVGVPLEDIALLALKRGLTLLGLLTVLFAASLFVINYLVKKKILNPLNKITEATDALCKGALDNPIEIETKKVRDEISDLAHSIELLRRSLNAMIKRGQRRS
jgi:HAMP domain-containing protein